LWLSKALGGFLHRKAAGGLRPNMLYTYENLAV
jgi:hypothetical protein